MRRMRSATPNRSIKCLARPTSAGLDGCAIGSANGYGNAVVDQIKTGVVRQIAIVEDQADDSLSWHWTLQGDELKLYKGLTLSPMPSMTFQNDMNVDQSYFIPPVAGSAA